MGHFFRSEGVGKTDFFLYLEVVERVLFVVRRDLRLDAGEGPEPLVRVTVRVLRRGDPLQVGPVVEGGDLGVLAHLGEQAEAEEPAREKESKNAITFV